MNKREKDTILIDGLKAIVSTLEEPVSGNKETRRFELKIPEELAERLHAQAFKGSTTKTAIVIAAISSYLDNLERG